jgi:proline dehydrogenase
MLRSFFIYLSKAGWARKIVTGWSIAWRVASRFVAGETLDQAINVVKSLNAKGINVTLDHLGEHVSNAQEAKKATDDIIDALNAIQSSGVRANVSIKLTQIGLALDPELCKANLLRIVEHAHTLNNFVRVDMEDSPVTQITLDLMRAARQQMPNVGIVIQSYLYRSAEDIADLMKDGIPVRLCKGAYLEPASVAFPKKADVDNNYDRLVEALFQGAIAHGQPRVSEDGRFPPIPGLATHDEKRVSYALEASSKLNLPKDALEFQMLNGIRRDLQEKLVKDGYPVRIYVPYGTEWYPYFMRRLAERPANVWFFIATFFRR